MSTPMENGYIVIRLKALAIRGCRLLERYQLFDFSIIFGLFVIYIYIF